MIENFNEATLFAQSLFVENDKVLNEIKKECIQDDIPIVTDEVLNYMIYIAKNMKAKDILEIGTACGYSGIYLTKMSNSNLGSFTSIEIDEKRHQKAKDNFDRISFINKEKVNLIYGDALDVLPTLNDKKYDFIFIDASKGQYQKFFDMSYKLLNEDGIIFIDNILFRGHVCNDDAPKRYNTIVKRLRDFVHKLNEEHNFILLPFGDGVGLVKK